MQGQAAARRDEPMANSPTSRSEIAYEHLLNEILRGRFQPGEVVSIYALAEELQVSRTPVSEALKRLETEGLVQIMPRVGCRVIRLNAPDVAEVFALSGALDGLVAAAAAAAQDTRGIAGLRRVSEQVENAVARDDKAAFDDRDYAFHDAIIEASQSPRVTRAARSSWLLLGFQMRMLPSPVEAMRECVEEHREIVKAIAAGDSVQARAAAERHSEHNAARAAAHLEAAAAARESPVARGFAI